MKIFGRKIFHAMALLVVPLGTIFTSRNSPGADLPLPLHTDGNRILNSKGEPVVLRGVNAASMEWTSDGEGHILKTMQVAIQDWHANIIRLPLCQDRWFGKTPQQHNGGQAYITIWCGKSSIFARPTAVM